MSQLIRFNYAGQYLKARLYERRSSKMECSVCDKRANGILLRHQEPDKKDTLICYECLVLLSRGMTINTDDKGGIFGKFNPKNIVRSSVRAKRKKVVKKMKVVANAKAKKTTKKDNSAEGTAGSGKDQGLVATNDKTGSAGGSGVSNDKTETASGPDKVL